MKQFYVIAALFAVQLNAWTQPILTDGQLPQTGTSYPLVTVDFNSQSELASGENITWDFADLPEIGTQEVRFEAIEDTPFATEMASADFAIFYEDSIQFTSTPTLGYQYMDFENARLSLMGEAAKQGFLVPYETGKMRLSLPVAFGVEDSSTFETSYTQNGNTVNIVGQTQVLVDSYGDLILPYGTHRNVLRVRTIETFHYEVDGVVLFPTTVTMFAWYAEDLLYPIFQVLSEKVEDSGTDAFVSAHYLVKEIVGIADQALRTDWQIYPNPSTDVFSVQYDLAELSDVQLVIYNTLGQAVLTQKYQQLVGLQKNNIDLSNYAKGNYLIQLTANAQQITKKIFLK